ncbi:MAG: hypothetical protein KGH61_00605 [Candidatus Micrarchaeota archaeon]|nr:hypothetical protein [Candidatus Micrarchaeota archaeon]MDE1847436.1 hypothetical protein [Candidatus Micrarchaeota archaeon]MDE1864069.1 hypothetical protein [Candidatus Micrarchaeota archaeon]
MSLLLPILIALLSIILPGFFLSLALLKKTKLGMFEIIAIGFVFGLIFPSTMIWLESYLINWSTAFAFSIHLYLTNVAILTIIGIVLCFWQGVFSTFSTEAIKPFLGISTSQTPDSAGKRHKERLFDLRQKINALKLDKSIVSKHSEEEEGLRRKQQEEFNLARDLAPEEKQRIQNLHNDEQRKLEEAHEKEEFILLNSARTGPDLLGNIVWIILILLILLTFATRLMSLSIAPSFFEFDPYFTMMTSEYILVHGYQVLYDHSAWPTLTAGSVHRLEPIIPYLQAYWYGLTNALQFHYTAFSTTLMSQVSSFYPPIAASLLVFVVFLFIRHEYGDFPAIIGAALTASMPAIITTFIAGEQLLEPWGILSLFFFYAAYLLAVNNMNDKRFAILAGIAFASTFLGAHYYTVDAGVLAIYILLQGIVSVLRRENTKPFYTMNVIVLAIIAVFYAVFAPYGSQLTNRVPTLLHVPIVVGFPLFALILVALIEYIPKILHQNKILFKRLDFKAYLGWLVLMAIIVGILVAFTSLGEPVQKYIQLSEHFTTPSIPLFATVQEYAPTGYNFNFGANGFGIIGYSILGINIIIWLVLAVFTALMLLAIYNRNSKFSILSLAAVWPLAIAGMIEVKYLPHFGLGYILAICAIIGELFIYAQNGFSFKKGVISIPSFNLDNTFMKTVVAVAIIAALLEGAVFINLASAALTPNTPQASQCTQLANSGNGIGYTMYCQTITQQWLHALAWMKANVGPFAPRILSWWDYGDWINWFGNSNAVLRGDNSVATSDYQTAAQYVLSQPDNVNTSTLASFMNSIQAKYVLFDDQLMQKWGALNFLACVHVNETSLAYAEQQGVAAGQPYQLGSSQCELSHSPIYAFVPAQLNSINNYCPSSNSTSQSLKVLLLAGNSFLNTTYCVPSNIFNGGNAAHLTTLSGNVTNMLIVPSQTFFYGIVKPPGATQQFGDFLVLFTPNGPNDTITDAPTLFYNSSYYKGFFFGKLPGFKLVYPGNFTGMNFINSYNQVMIFSLDNYTGGLPPVAPKASYVRNNYTMPG